MCLLQMAQKLAGWLLCVCAVAAPNVTASRDTVGVRKGAPLFFEGGGPPLLRQSALAGGGSESVSAVPRAGCLHGKCSMY